MIRNSETCAAIDLADYRGPSRQHDDELLQLTTYQYSIKGPLNTLLIGRCTYEYEHLYNKENRE